MNAADYEFLLPFRRRLVSAERPLVFIHTPKCAGTSVSGYLADVFEDHLIYPGRFPDHFWTIPTGYSVYTGHHFLRQWDGVATSPQFVTWLRDPVARVVSNYYFHAGIPDKEIEGQGLDFVRRIKETPLSEYAAWGYDESHSPRNLCARFLAERPGEPLGDDDSLLRDAVANLSRFSFIGFAETMGASLAALAARFRLPRPKRSYHVNTYEQNTGDRGVDVAARKPVSPEVLEAIRRSNRVDVALYEIARERAVPTGRLARMWAAA